MQCDSIILSVSLSLSLCVITLLGQFHFGGRQHGGCVQDQNSEPHLWGGLCQCSSGQRVSRPLPAEGQPAICMYLLLYIYMAEHLGGWTALFTHCYCICPCMSSYQHRGMHQYMCVLLQVRASDNGSPPRHTDHSLTINILDVNDNAPVIESQRGYNVSISEVGKCLHSTYTELYPGVIPHCLYMCL